MQHANTPPLAPIPARVVPQPWEDLASYISRLAAEMGYRNPGWLLHPEGVDSAVRPFNLCLLRRKADYQFFERLLCLSAESLYGLTLHRFALCLPVPEVSRPTISEEIRRPLLTRYIFQTFFHPYSATKVCSICLSEEPAHSRLYWSALPVVACLRHKVFLTDRCPVCQRPIPLLRPSLSNCPRCQKGDYRQTPTVHMPEDPFFSMGQALILYNLGIQSAMGDAQVAHMSITPLLQLLPWQYFLLLDAFRCILGPLFPDAPFLQVSADARVLLRRRPRPQSELSLLEWSVIIATVHSLCASWPDKFFSFLDALPHTRSERRRKRDRQRATGLHRDFGVFYEKWLYKRLTHPAFAFLHEAFETYLRSRYTGGEVTRRLLPFKNPSGEQLQERPYLTKAQARAVLGIGEDALQVLITQGILRTFKKPMGSAERRTMFLIEKESAQALRREWEGLIPLDVVARSCLGVNKAVVIALERAGMLLPKRGPDVDGYKLRLYSPTDIERFEKTLLLHAKKAPECLTDCVSLPKFSTLAGIALVDLLNEIFKNRIGLTEINVHRPLLCRLVLSRAEIPGFLRAYKQRRREELGLLTAHQVALELDISEKVLKRWMQCGLLEGRRLGIDGKKPSLLFQREALEAFHCTYVLMDEAAQLLGVAPCTLSKYMRKGILHPVVGRRTRNGGNRLLFIREEVESLLQPASLAVCEVVRLLGVSRSLVYHLIQVGELPSVRLSDRGSKRTRIRLLLSDVEAYQRRMVDFAQSDKRQVKITKKKAALPDSDKGIG